MKVDVRELENNQKAISVEIPEEAVMQKINELYRQINASAKLKGFRPGKVPRNILKKYFWDVIKSQIVTDLVPDYLQKAIDEKKLRLIDKPKFEGDIEVREKSPLLFEFIVTTWPRVDLPADYKEINLVKEKKEVSEEHVLSVLKELQNQHAKYQVTTDRAVSLTDQVVLDYKSFNAETGKLIEEKADLVMEVGSKNFLGVLSNNLIGLSRGEEKEFEEILPYDFPREDLTNKKIRFRIVVKEIKEKILPEIDEDFAKDLGDYTMQSLKAELAEDIDRKLEEESMTNVRNSLLDALVAKTSFDPPAIMVEQEIENMIHDITSQLAIQGKRIHQTEPNIAKLRSDLRESAGKKVRTSLILYEIALREGIEASRNEIEQQIQQLAMYYKQSAQEIAKLYKLEIERSIREQKTIDFLLEHLGIR